MPPDELTFTPSGTHAVHTGVSGVLAGRRRTGRHLVLSAVEHSSLLHAAAAQRGGRGRGDRGAGGAHGRGTARVVRVGAARGDRPGVPPVGQPRGGHWVQPVAEVAEACRAAGVPLLVDAAQSLAWGPVEAGWSVLTGSAHKWGGPAGVGLLAVRKGVRFAAPGPADERESGRSPGFPTCRRSWPPRASLRAVRAEAAAEAERLRGLVDRIRAQGARTGAGRGGGGRPAAAPPHLVTFSCLYVDGEALLHGLDRAGFSVSSGSSCTSSTLTPSHVLRAMGVLSEGNVRVSLPAGVAEAEVERFLDVLPGVVADVREQLGAPAAGAPAGAAREAGELVVDALGKRCPVPVIELAKAIGDVPVGGTVRVVTDDEVAALDIRAWCWMRDQEYVGEEPAERGAAYVVRRRT